ncbi:GIY-YIG nuclease family protein [Propionibacteriaceae bacterium Y1700]|uniref:GIY-YIG nuclease family protein n=1 Tax=Microlunatus sp. Y1700 TaxID=3418487 RepID=UPI003DA74344
MPWTFMLRCNDDSLYVGSAQNLEVRVAQHSAGQGAKYTAQRLPVTLIWAQDFDRIDEAWAMEKRIQNWSRAKRLALAEGRFPDLPGLSRSRWRPGERSS